MLSALMPTLASVSLDVRSSNSPSRLSSICFTVANDAMELDATLSTF